MYRTGSIPGITGPSIFLFKGKICHANDTDKFLQGNGTAPGSSIMMIPTAFMTEETWVESTSKVIYGSQNTDYIVKANPPWRVAKIFDAFGPHMPSLQAMQMRADAKICYVKEEGNSSHVKVLR
jgi:hypothetical protein